MFSCLKKQVIPNSIAGLQKLEELDVSSNLLESPPDSVGFLLNLRVLNVSGNKLNALPESIANCRYASCLSIANLPFYLILGAHPFGYLPSLHLCFFVSVGH